MSSRKAVEFFYDVVSPYTWFAFEVLCRYQHKWDITLKLRPVFLGGIMNESGNRAPAMVPNKAVYMMQTDIPLLGKYFGVPVNIPKDPNQLMFVKGTLTAQRFLTALNMSRPEKVEDVSRELFLRAWSKDEDISEPGSLAEAAKKAGLSEDETGQLLGAMKEPLAKETLKKVTQEALDMGAFGSPTILAKFNGNKQWVFGSDRFPVLADLLGEKWEGPNPGASSKL